MVTRNADSFDIPESHEEIQEVFLRGKHGHAIWNSKGKEAARAE